jgi:hypothetical protein
MAMKLAANTNLPVAGLEILREVFTPPSQPRATPSTQAPHPLLTMKYGKLTEWENHENN